MFMFSITPGGGVLPGILGGCVPPGSPSPDPISHQKMSFFTLFSDQTSKIHAHFQTCPFRQKLFNHYLA